MADAVENEGEPDAVTRCLEKAGSCDRVAACLHRQGNPRAEAFCVAHPGVKTGCDGNALVTCASDDPAESMLTPCSPLGATCGESHTAGGLVAHGCLTPAVCPPNVSRVRCNGETAIAACHDEILEKVACVPGKTCHPHADDDGEEAATCESAGEVACEKVGERSCQADVLIECIAHGHHAREKAVDCRSRGLACGASGGQPACVAPEAACTAGAPRCDRGALVFCAAGRYERVDCGDIGLGPCGGAGNGLCTPRSP